MNITPWPHQQRGIEAFWAKVNAGRKRICITSPTGGGKTILSVLIMKKALEMGHKIVFHVNRSSLAAQTKKNFEQYGLPVGIRASGHVPELDKPIQVSMTPTEDARALRDNPSWNLHDADMVIFDEAHGEKTRRAHQLVREYSRNKEPIITGLTATPVDIWNMYDDLVVAGTNSELRECGAHLWCREYCPTMPDMLGVVQAMRAIKKNADGEISEKESERLMMVPKLFGHVFKWHNKLNPEYRPTILFAPSIQASIWFVDGYRKNGIRAAHIDGKSIYLGKKDKDGNNVMYDSRNMKHRERLFGMYRDGEIQVLSNKFVLVEGIDFPFIHHCIMATVFGSLKQFLQSGGRLLRNHDSLEDVVLQDHSGHFWMHGSLNDDRIWEVGDKSKELFDEKMRKREEGEEPEPIVCPRCGAMRMSGPKCWECGLQSTESGLNILQTDGTLKKVKGPYVKRRKPGKPQAIKAWQSLYFPIKNSRRSGSPNWHDFLKTYKRRNPDLFVFETKDDRGRKRIAAADKNGEVTVIPFHPPIGVDSIWSKPVKRTNMDDLVR